MAQCKDYFPDVYPIHLVNAESAMKSKVQPKKVADVTFYFPQHLNASCSKSFKHIICVYSDLNVFKSMQAGNYLFLSVIIRFCMYFNSIYWFWYIFINFFCILCVFLHASVHNYLYLSIISSW